MTEKFKNVLKDLEILIQRCILIKNKMESGSAKVDDNSMLKQYDPVIFDCNHTKNELIDEKINISETSIHKENLMIINNFKMRQEDMETKERDLLTDLRRIDQLLMSDELSNDEINRLLDKRSQITTIKEFNSNTLSG